jgi:hypothetical protein
MRLRRGCGCPILIILLLDLLLATGGIITLIRGPSDKPFQATRLGAGISTVIMSANVIACGLLAVGTLREGRLGGSTPGTSASDYEEGDGATEEPKGSDPENEEGED